MSDAFGKMIQQMMESGQDMLRAVNPAMAQMPDPSKAGPVLSAEMMEMWFGKTFNREGLDAKTRLLVSLAALTLQGAQVEAAFKTTLRHALAAGATEREITEVIWQMSMFGGLPAMRQALEMAQAVFDEREEARS